MSRKGFNFYRSYYDVAMELSDKDFCAFIKALLQKQFDGIEPSNLIGMANFAYLSQKHSIDSQISGYEAKTGLKLTPTEGGKQGGNQGGSVQEKEKGKEKEEYTRKPRKISFEDSELFDKNKFVETFSTWSKEKMGHYYDAALRYSVEGNKYVSWKLTIEAWAKKDNLNNIKIDTPKSTKHSGLI